MRPQGQEMALPWDADIRIDTPRQASHVLKKSLGGGGVTSYKYFVRELKKEGVIISDKV